MPSYSFEIATENGTERHSFTIDHDRPLGPQVTQVLEELRQRGVVLKGGRDDELGIFWSGRELDPKQRAVDLGISPAKPIELRMQDRPAARSATSDRSLPRGALASSAFGYAGALAAWLLTALWSDTTNLVPSYVRLDQVTMFVLGGLVGAAVLGGAALRTSGSLPLALAAGLVLAAAGATMGASLALLLPAGTLRAFTVARVAGWALAAGLASLFLACYALRLEPRRLTESLAVGLVAGAIGGVLFALPGPSEVWQAIAFLVFGAGVGLAVCGPMLWRAAAIVELAPARWPPSILGLREWPVHEGSAVPIGTARVACQQGQVAFYPAPAGATVAGRTVSKAVFLPSDAPIVVDGRAYRIRIMAALVLFLAAALPIRAQSPAPVPEPARLHLVRCVPEADAPCLTTRITLHGHRAAVVASLDSTAEAGAWTGGLGRTRLVGPGVVVSRRVEPPLRLLVLLDRSGTMMGQGIAFTRITLKSFIESLDSGSVRVAVAGFESREVARGIAAAEFLTPAEAAEALQRVPPPDARGNTALYSALVEANRSVSEAVRATPGSRGAILLVTDGRENDVGHPGDDPDLLAGPSGQAEAVAATRSAGHRIWIVGVGEKLGTEELVRLAGANGSVAVARLDPNAMAARLSAIRRELHGARELTFGVPGGRAAALARAPWSGNAAAWLQGQPVVTQTLAWRPPLFALPAYEGVAAAVSLPPALRDAALAAPRGPGVRTLIALCAALIGAVLWGLGPRLAWARPPEPAGASAEAGPAAPPAAPAPSSVPTAADGGGLRRDVREAPPRKPADVTQEVPALSASATPSRRGRGR